MGGRLFCERQEVSKSVQDVCRDVQSPSLKPLLGESSVLGTVSNLTRNSYGVFSVVAMHSYNVQ